MTPDSPSDPPTRKLELARGPVTYTDVGDGPAVVAVHGLPGSVRDFRWLGTVVEPHVRFIRVDLPASGGTPLATMPSPDVADRAEVVLDVVGALGLDEVTVIGHSFGGLIAMTAASLWPERFTRAGLLASVGREIHRGFRNIPAPHLVAKLLRTPLLGRVFFPLYLRGMKTAGFRGRYTRDELAHMNACIASVSFATNRATLANLDVSTMVAWAEDDPLVDTSVSRDLADVAPDGPRLQWPNGGHNIQKSRAVEIGEALVAWTSPPHPDEDVSRA